VPVLVVSIGWAVAAVVDVELTVSALVVIGAATAAGSILFAPIHPVTSASACAKPAFLPFMKCCVLFSLVQKKGSREGAEGGTCALCYYATASVDSPLVYDSFEPGCFYPPRRIPITGTFYVLACVPSCPRLSSGFRWGVGFSPHCVRCRKLGIGAKPAARARLFTRAA